MNKTMDLEFEAWARQMSMDLEYRNIPGVGKFYECPRTLLALEAWKASRAAIEVELPPLSGMDSSFVADGIQKTREHNCYNAAVNDCRKAIKSLGLRVKQ